MNILTITQVTKLYDVTPRMLRHYEKLVLITPCKSAITPTACMTKLQ